MSARALLCAALIAVMSLAATGCGSTGRALEYDGISSRAAPIRPGTELGLFMLTLHNTGTSVIRLRSVTIGGFGVGAVVRVVKVAIGAAGDVPGGIYTEDPPVFLAGHRCHRAVLAPVRGYRMRPGGYARLWVVIRAIRPGRWVIPKHIVSYSMQGFPGVRTLTQDVGLRLRGSVSAGARYLPVDRTEARCARSAVARLLPGFHRP